MYGSEAVAPDALEVGAPFDEQFHEVHTVHVGRDMERLPASDLVRHDLGDVDERRVLVE